MGLSHALSATDPACMCAGLRQSRPNVTKRLRFLLAKPSQLPRSWMRWDGHLVFQGGLSLPVVIASSETLVQDLPRAHATHLNHPILHTRDPCFRYLILLWGFIVK